LAGDSKTDLTCWRYAHVPDSSIFIKKFQKKFGKCAQKKTGDKVAQTIIALRLVVEILYP
jgi:hypothetical protein